MCPLMQSVTGYSLVCFEALIVWIKEISFLEDFMIETDSKPPVCLEVYPSHDLGVGERFSL